MYTIINFEGNKMNFNKRMNGWYYDNFDFLEFFSEEEAKNFLLKNDRDDKYTIHREESL
jgi:hypothetical protein